MHTRVVVLGAGFGSARTEPGALVSHQFWKESLGAPASLAGRSVNAFGLILPIVSGRDCAG